jgi:hypothetical protein
VSFGPDYRRTEPRISVDGPCIELDNQLYRPAQILEVSESGLRIQRPAQGWHSYVVQLEFDIPGIDEVMWASGELRFDRQGQHSDVRTSGIALRAAANRHKRMLREFVNDTWRATVSPIEFDWPGRASCYLLG